MTLDSGDRTWVCPSELVGRAGARGDMVWKRRGEIKHVMRCCFVLSGMLQPSLTLQLLETKRAGDAEGFCPPCAEPGEKRWGLGMADVGVP